MTTFPLYDTLSLNLPKKALLVKQKADLVKNLMLLDQNSQELVYALIKYHTIREKIVSEEIPYNGTSIPTPKKKGCEDITWDLSNFPPKLLHILNAFVILDNQRKIEEQNNRELDETY